MKNDDLVKYHFRTHNYISLKDISLGIMIATNRNLVYGLKGREYFFEINLLFIHIKIGIIRDGHRTKIGKMIKILRGEDNESN
jgi:hypothetical protein